MQIGLGVDRLYLKRNIRIGTREVGQPRAEPTRDEPAMGTDAKGLFSGGPDLPYHRFDLPQMTPRRLAQTFALCCQAGTVRLNRVA